ncbi:MOSC domain-containing protein [Streptomyces sp. P9(2023)]|uniref:MOSC domain-containing protein n=1 Tax=Streptomyces sp. P9(2023) TaxID=3064394 RepID=UPI0028F41759|nr:MOSC N-terminal beta barrel domain-containing protein [Streptomyces sp. P9(2023)]MDT9687440.1 MOSC domain-containing protein [Streptomyces sp. P9(2023)]
MQIPRLYSVHVHPVKALRGHAPAEAEVESWGLAGDRRWTVVDASGKVVTQRRHPRMALASAEPLPGGGIRLSAAGRPALSVEVPRPSSTMRVEVFDTPVEAVPAGPAADAWFSAFLETEARLVHMDDPARRRPIDPAYALPGETVSFADGYPLLATCTSSLDALNALIAQGDHADEGPLPMNRFRPNVVIEGTLPWAEDGWSRLAIGEVMFRVARACGRCVVTTTDQLTAARGKEPLRTLGAHRRQGNKVIFGQNLVPEHRGTIRVGDEVKILD